MDVKQISFFTLAIASVFSCVLASFATLPFIALHVRVQTDSFSLVCFARALRAKQTKDILLKPLRANLNALVGTVARVALAMHKLSVPIAVLLLPSVLCVASALLRVAWLTISKFKQVATVLLFTECLPKDGRSKQSGLDIKPKYRVVD